MLGFGKKNVYTAGDKYTIKEVATPQHPDVLEKTVKPGFIADTPVTGVPLSDRFYLRPLQTPIWDSEIYNPEKPVLKLNFFERPVGQPMQCVDAEKTLNDTCLVQPRALVFPKEFSILGFKVLLERGISKEDEAAIINTGVFRFRFSDRDPYPEIPLEMLARTIGPLDGPYERDVVEKINALMKDETIDWSKIAPVRDALKEVLRYDIYHRFNLGRSAIRIKSDEVFSASIDWNKPPVVSKPVRIQVVLVGLFWKGL
jgi:hypothetical protein